MDAQQTPDAGALGQPVRLGRSELATLRRAARQRWGVPDDMKTEAILAAQEMLDSPDARERKAALAFLAAVDRIDQADDRLDLERAKLARPVEADARDAWQELAEEILGDGRPVHDPPGPGEIPG